jgi:hypothetical protein
MNNLDKWCAEQCGVDPDNPQDDFYADWDIQDPRCREIVREHFTITMDFLKGDWIAQGGYCITRTCMGKGKTIAEAECNCITQIYEASK